MELVFADNSSQKQPTRDGMGGRTREPRGCPRRRLGRRQRRCGPAACRSGPRVLALRETKHCRAQSGPPDLDAEVTTVEALVGSRMANASRSAKAPGRVRTGRDRRGPSPAMNSTPPLPGGRSPRWCVSSPHSGRPGAGMSQEIVATYQQLGVARWAWNAMWWTPLSSRDGVAGMWRGARGSPRDGSTSWWSAIGRAGTRRSSRAHGALDRVPTRRLRQGAGCDHPAPS